jgi:hypothetical protein
VSPCGIGTNRDEIIQLTPFQNDQGRHDFREAGGGHSLPGIVFIQHTSTIEFLEKNAMGWSDSPRRELVRSNPSSNMHRLSSYALCKGDGWRGGLGTDQQETDEHPSSADEKWQPMGSPAVSCHPEIVAPTHSV